MKKIFVKLSMLLFVLVMSTTAWADMDVDFESLPQNVQEALTAASVYSARLTGYASSTGGGKVYVNTADTDPRGNEEYNEGTSNVATNSWAISLPGMDISKVYINAWAQPDPGYRLLGWSFTNEGVDLGVGEVDDSGVPVGKYVQKYDVATVAGQTVDYDIYATFERIRFLNYSIGGTNTTVNGECAPTVSAVLNYDDIAATDFKTPVVNSEVGGGTWTPSELSFDGNTVSLTVNFAAPDGDAADYSANLVLETQAGVKLNVPLNARTVQSGVQAIRYNKTKDFEAQGDLSAMLSGASVGDIVKLNNDYSGDPVFINKNITFDLNGYTFSNALTVNGNAKATLAYSPYGGTITGDVSVAAGSTLVLNGGIISGEVTNNGTLEQNGASVSGEIHNYGTMTTTDGVHTDVLTKYSGATLTINGGTFETSGSPIANNGTAVIKKGTITSTGSYAVFTQAQGNTTIEKWAVIQGESSDLYCIDGGSQTVKCGKFTDPYKFCEGNVTFISAYFMTNYNELSEVKEKKMWRNTSGAEFREGYEFFAGDIEAAKKEGVSVCHIGSISYSSLEDALAYANNTSDKATIIMDNDYALPAGYYTLPSNATLIIPMDNDQNAEYKVVNKEASTSESDWEEHRPSVFRKLTLLNGVNIDVHGTIEVSGSQFSSNKNFTGATYGPYGQIQMNPGSKMVLQNNSELRVWGYVTGDIDNLVNDSVLSGEIDARRGSTVRELFQMGDWKGAAFSAMGLVQGDSVFPINTYFIQNIEAPVKYHPGSRLSTATTVHEGAMGIVMSANDIQIIGVSLQDVAMFLMDANADAENTWVRKFYDAKHDQQVYEINSGAHIGQLVISLMSSPLLPMLGQLDDTMQGLINLVTGGTQENPGQLPEDVVMNSGQYFLPITNNFKLHVLSGELSFTQSTALLPGAEVEIDKDALVSIERRRNGVKSGSLFVYDWRDWGNYADGAPGQEVKYSPVFGGAPAKRDVSTAESIGSACVNVHGSFDTKGGYVLTTQHGGNIYSSLKDAGTFIFSQPTQAEGYSEVIKQYDGSYHAITCYPVWLRNNNNPRPSNELTNEENAVDYVKTEGKVAAGGESFCYLDIDGTGGRWTKLEQRGCFTYDDGSDVYYIKPQEYVAVVVDAEWNDTEKKFISISGNADYTFSDAAGAGRLFINLGNPYDASTCQWWEVEQKDNYYHCIHPQNDTYYEWNDDDEEWQEVKFTITWKDKKWGSADETQDSILQTYTVPYGTQAEWLSTNPTRAKNVDYTYDFTGWSPELGKVTSDVTYTATYEAKQIKYTITFIQDGGVEIERHLLARDEVPVCENEPTRTGYILQWEPALGPVTGNQTYTATWLPEPPETYTITFKNYNGTTLLECKDATAVTAGETPVYTGATPSKDPTSEYTYVFTGWKPALAPATTNATYVAQFDEVEQTYEIKFYDEAGSNELKTENLTYGATPTPPTYITKSDPAEGTTYTYVWKTLDGSKNIETVTAAANYKPVFTGTLNKYTVTLQCNVPGACSFTGAGIYDYGTENVTIAATINDPTAYEFVQWTTETTHSFGSLTITEDVLITVMVKQKNQTPGNLELDIDATETVASATNYTDVIITSDGIEHSSQIFNANNITLYGNADFNLVKEFAGSTWYCVAVPWRVNVNGGILLNGTTPAVLGQNIDICYYDGSVRAAQGKVDACWVYMRNLGASQQVLQPGRAYMIALRNGASSITFRKKIQEPLLTTGTSVQQYNSMTGNDADAGWNGIANPSLFHAYINAGADDEQYGLNFGQVYDSENDAYNSFNMSSNRLVVGQPIYVQVPSSKSIVANNSSYAGAPVRRIKATQPTSFDVNITAAGASKYADHISVSLNDDKEEDKYVIGQDLVKFGVSTKVAQMWINRYDAKLCVNTIAPEGDVTTFPMSIYAPKAGEYSIAIEREENTNDYALYLTYNGEAIWNLSDGAYTLNLNKGTISNYGLRVSARAPQVTTGVDEAIVEAQGETAMKVLINNQVFIIRGNRVYSVDGQLVK